jgi:hypothetical protein
MKNLFTYIMIVLFVCTFMHSVSATAELHFFLDNGNYTNSSLNLVNPENPDDKSTIMSRVYFFSMREGFIFMGALSLIIIFIMIIIVILLFALVRDIVEGLAGGGSNKFHKVILIFIAVTLLLSVNVKAYAEDFENAKNNLSSIVTLSYTPVTYENYLGDLSISADNLLVTRASINYLQGSSDSYSGDNAAIESFSVDGNNADAIGVNEWRMYQENLTAQNILLTNDTYFVLDIKSTSNGMPNNKVGTVLWITSTSYAPGFYVWLDRNPAFAGCSINAAIGSDLVDHQYKRLLFTIKNISDTCGDIDMQQTLAGNPYIAAVALDIDTKNGNSTNATFGITLDSLYINDYPNTDLCGITYAEHAIVCNALGVKDFELVNTTNPASKDTIMARLYYFTLGRAFDAQSLFIIFVIFIFIILIFAIFMLIVDVIKGMFHMHATPRMKRP